jgi:hypothetical protein
MSSSKSIIGKCKLCHSHGELRDSHFIPKSAYRLIQRSEGEPPVVIKHTVAMQTNEQVRDYVLCQKCEQRFNENGERWVMEHCYRDGQGFKLKDLIDATEPLMGNGLKVYSAAGIPQIDVEKLTYFVASIMWRISAHEWKSGKDKIRRLYLGKYTEELRHYLLGETAFPPNAALWISIIPDSNLWNIVTPPYGEKLNQCWRYKSPFLGISFMFFLGARIDPIIRRTCTYRSPEKFVFVSDEASEMVIRDFGRLITKSRPVGSLK